MSGPSVAAIPTYDPMTGEFWRDGERVDHGRKDGYRRVSINGERVLAHRAAFFLTLGEWPEDIVDHIDGNPANNRWENLRPTTRAGNLQNQRRAQGNNRSGFLGVSINRVGSFYARIGVNGDRKYLGYFTTAAEAHQAYVAAKRELHPLGTL